MNLKWISEGRATCGGFCSAQGGFEHISTPAVAFSNLVSDNALYTYQKLTLFIGYCCSYVLYHLCTLEPSCFANHRPARFHDFVDIRRM